MADATDTIGIHLGARLQQIDGPHIVPDCLHAAALKLTLFEVISILAEARIIGGQRHVATFREVDGITQVLALAESGRFRFSDRDGLVQTEYGRQLGVRSSWYEQIGRHTVILLDSKGKLPANIMWRL